MAADMSDSRPPAVLMLGTGEYTTGYTAHGAAKSDKSTGVVALVMLDLQRRGKVGELGMCGTDGTKLPAIRAHMQAALGGYSGISPSAIRTWPADGVVDRRAYLEAVRHFGPGDCAIIFTPDDTHGAIASACLARGMHVMITKPPVKTLAEHNAIVAEARKVNRLAVVEVHKRFDPIYVDARDRIASSLGTFSYFTAHMSQPKHQLDTFASWAGKSSDISYYLNSHHVDFHEWCMRGLARAESVTALASDGIASERLGRSCEDTITLAVKWRNKRPPALAADDAGAADVASDAVAAVAGARSPSKRARTGDGSTRPSFTGNLGHATYTSSWVAPRADVHSQQRWFYMGSAGEITVDQAHRGYTLATDEGGFASVNPLFWKPAKDAVTGAFAGQRCYGYLSFETYIDAAAACNDGRAVPANFDSTLPTLATTAGATAILEAGRLSLDAGGRPYELVYGDEAAETPSALRPVAFPPP
mmetsp:Transcript_6728/g.17459  ORF Transcript_6728/g.17459 Transcript_6728/m.17459 type:complete len:475 (-) Transcript_6728:1148-2572(-)